ncbi:unnamed protein product [Blepharisma stoltei]|uniref:Uncharacterized protein n=1 Tax=Blepharisma stoltei TaxID=1481888 RepID=A0AAU9JRM2_9CILI|nr:unnamed protein product [Blepharisma stoltei]
MQRVLSIDPFLLDIKPVISHHPGRKSKKDAFIRKLFYTCSEYKTLPPKKEYLRCKLIRGFKRAIRQIRKNVLPSKTLNRIRGNPYNTLRVWQALAGCYEKYIDILDSISCTENKASSDEKNKKKVKGAYLEKSFNSKLCNQFFTHIGVRETFYYYIEFLFADLNPESLCDKFDFMCCNGVHINECVEKWLMIKKYMNCYMIQDLGLEPWFPLSYSNSFLPSIFTVRINDSTSNGTENCKKTLQEEKQEIKDDFFDNEAIRCFLKVKFA